MRSVCLCIKLLIHSEQKKKGSDVDQSEFGHSDPTATESQTEKEIINQNSAILDSFSATYRV